MKEYVSQQIKNLEPSGIRKFFDVVNDMPDAISLGVGEPDFETPMNIRTQAICSLEQGKTFYTSNAASACFKTPEICKYVRTSKYNVSYNPKNEILITVGGS